MFSGQLVLAQVDSVFSSIDSTHHSYISKSRDGIHQVQSLLTLKGAKQLLPTDRIDSLRQRGSLDTIETKSDSLRYVVGSKVDSIKSVPGLGKARASELENKLTSPIDKANSKVHEIEAKLFKPIDSLQNALTLQVDSVHRSIVAKRDSIEQLVNGKIQKITDALGIDADDISLKDAKVPSTAIGLDKDILPELSIDKDKLIPDDLLQLEGTKVADEFDEFGKKTADLKAKSKELKSMPQQKMKELPGAEQLQKVNTQLTQLDGKLEKVEKLEGDARLIAEGRFGEMKQVPEEIEKRLLAMADTKELTAHTAKIKEYEAMINKYKDKKLLQQEAKSKALNVANEYMAGNMAAIKSAEQKYSKQKKVVGDFKSLKDVPKRMIPNELRGKPFYTRVVPGLTLQVYQTDRLILDVAPQLGFRFQTRVTAGLGYTYRFSINKEYDYFVKGLGVYGPRAYGEFLIAKGFYAHADIEYLHAATEQPGTTDIGTETVLASYFGIGKSYSISRRIKASALALYRFEYDGHLAGQKKFNLRMGFDWQMGKRKKKLKF